MKRTEISTEVKPNGFALPTFIEKIRYRTRRDRRDDQVVANRVRKLATCATFKIASEDPSIERDFWFGTELFKANVIKRRLPIRWVEQHDITPSDFSEPHKTIIVL